MEQAALKGYKRDFDAYMAVDSCVFPVLPCFPMAGMGNIGVRIKKRKELSPLGLSSFLCVALEGFEPSQAEPESDVLPLHHKAIQLFFLFVSKRLSCRFV